MTRALSSTDAASIHEMRTAIHLQVIKATISAAFPEHSVLGEESVPSGSAASAAALESFLSKEWLWIVDPIDGTTNFVHGMPASVVSIGVAHNGKVCVDPPCSPPVMERNIGCPTSVPLLHTVCRWLWGSSSTLSAAKCLPRPWAAVRFATMSASQSASLRRASARHSLRSARGARTIWRSPCWAAQALWQKCAAQSARLALRHCT